MCGRGHKIAKRWYYPTLIRKVIHVFPSKRRTSPLVASNRPAMINKSLIHQRPDAPSRGIELLPSSSSKLMSFKTCVPLSSNTFETFRKENNNPGLANCHKSSMDSKYRDKVLLI